MPRKIKPVILPDSELGEVNAFINARYGSSVNLTTGDVIPRVLNSMNYNPEFTYVDYDRGISLAVPDQALSVEQILSMYTRGLPVPTYNMNAVDMDMSFVDRMDKFERIDYARRLEERRRELVKLYESEQADLKAIDDERKFNDAVQAKLDSIKKGDDNVTS